MRFIVLRELRANFLSSVFRCNFAISEVSGITSIAEITRDEAAFNPAARIFDPLERESITFILTTWRACHKRFPMPGSARLLSVRSLAAFAHRLSAYFSFTRTWSFDEIRLLARDFNRRARARMCTYMCAVEYNYFCETLQLQIVVRYKTDSANSCEAYRTPRPRKCAIKSISHFNISHLIFVLLIGLFEREIMISAGFVE